MDDFNTRLNSFRKELKDLCKQELSVYSIPKDFEIRKELPKTLYSKIDYKKLEKEENTKYREDSILQ